MTGINPRLLVEHIPQTARQAISAGAKRAASIDQRYVAVIAGALLLLGPRLKPMILAYVWRIIAWIAARLARVRARVAALAKPMLKASIAK